MTINGVLEAALRKLVHSGEVDFADVRPYLQDPTRMPEPSFPAG